MTATEKYLAMNNEFCRLRDAIYNPDVDEADEDERIQKSVEMALGVLCQYLVVVSIAFPKFVKA